MVHVFYHNKKYWGNEGKYVMWLPWIRVTANGQEVAFWSGGNVLEVNSGDACTICEYTKTTVVCT